MEIIYTAWVVEIVLLFIGSVVVWWNYKNHWW